MNDSQLDRYLNSVGKRCFVRYFDRFSDQSLSNREVAEILQEEMGFTWKACNSRTGHARMIIRSGRAIDALEIVRGSKAEARTREKAVELVETCAGAGNPSSLSEDNDMDDDRPTCRHHSPYDDVSVPQQPNTGTHSHVADNVD